MRYGENNHHVHDGYEEEMAPSSDIIDTDEEESKNSIVHEPQDQNKLEKYKKARYAIGNVSMKDLSNKIKVFETIVKLPYFKRIPKHEPTSSYFHLVMCLGECMMICSEKN